ncbi:MAG TPA: hypothetical protein VNC39_07685 [Acidocella sp.]|jgi:hypothetical protein|uniref:hypothetical protein n=1 Tax=Acidocella sp. TaxID=50710 RepID=UPI002C65D195|nr:hypothetical protein [Acidocella sp.]HVE21840.1 hypothetical protein [Acidocella sp.]
MSMSISGSVLSAVQAAGQMFGGYGILTIGPMQLTGMELPDSMPVGGKQMIGVSTMVGGGLCLDAMGPVENSISWRGQFTGPNRTVRARLLDSIRKSGSVVTLAWDVFSYQVIVAEFAADTRSVDPVPYKITCIVLEDNSSPTGNTLTSLVSQVVADVSSGNVVGALSSLSAGVATPITTASTSVAQPGATTLGTAAYDGAVGAVNAASGAINAAAGAANGLLGQFGTNLLGVSQAATTAASIPAVAAVINGAAGAAGDAANLRVAGGYFGRAATNLLNASA